MFTEIFFDDKRELIQQTSGTQISPKSAKSWTASTPRKTKLRNNLKRKRETIRRKLVTSAKSEDIVSVDASKLSDEAKNLVINLANNANKKSRGKRYSKAFKEECITLMHKSASCYKMLQKTLMLPSKQTLKRQMHSVSFHEGIMPDIMRLIKNKMNMLKNEDKMAVLSFDEMTIKKRVVYSSQEDSFLGYVSYDRKQLASNALVFNLKGLKSGWKQVVAYYFTGQGKAEVIGVCLKEVLRALEASEVNVIAVVCDQGSSNQKLYRSLGVSVTNPLFRYEGKVYYALYDAPHLLKSVRNNFLKYNIATQNGIAKLDHVKTFLDEDLSTPIR